jgi:hypothetical protein
MTVHFGRIELRALVERLSRGDAPLAPPGDLTRSGEAES